MGANLTAKWTAVRRGEDRLAAALASAALAALLVLAPAAPAAAGGLIAADEAHRRAGTGELLIIDVRSPGEWRQTGLPEGAAAVTIHDPRGPDGFLAAIMAATGGDTERPIALICASGTRSSRAHRFLEAKGFGAVLDISEGMMGRRDLPGWLERGLPTEPCRNC